MQRTVFFKMEKREKRKYLYIAGLAVAICLIVQNFSLVITLLSLSFVALTPMLIGCIIAYIFNIIMNFFEKHYFPKSKSPKIIASRRPLCLILSFTIVIATITLVLKVVIPEFISGRSLFALPLINQFNGCGRSKPYLIFALTDETFSILTTTEVPPGVKAEEYYFAVSLLDQIYWVSGSLIGGLAGAIIPFDMTGVDFALTALFAVLTIDQIKKFARERKGGENAGF